MKKKRAVIVFDGSNFYHKLKSLKLKKTSTFDYDNFCKFVAKPLQIIDKYYCVGKIQAKQHDVKAREMMARQQALVTRLKRLGFQIKFGYLLKSEDHFHEKGTDVEIAVNIMRGAYKNEYDVVYLISSDSDLIPAITEAQRMGKKVVYVGFMHKPSFALLKTCSESKLLTKEELQQFLK